MGTLTREIDPAINDVRGHAMEHLRGPEPSGFSTRRLNLRRCTPEDADAVFAYRKRGDVAKYLRNGIWSRAKTEDELSTYARAPFKALDDELVLLAEDRETSVVVGEVGLVWKKHGTAEIGYVFHPEYGGRGFATEAVQSLIIWAIHELGFNKVIARTDAANLSSIALCRRVGLHVTGESISTDGRDQIELLFETDALPQFDK